VLDGDGGSIMLDEEEGSVVRMIRRTMRTVKLLIVVLRYGGELGEMALYVMGASLKRVQM